MPCTCKLGKNKLCKYGSFSLVNIIISYCREIIYIMKLSDRINILYFDPVPEFHYVVNIIISYCRSREVIYIMKQINRKPLGLNMTHYNNKNNNEIRH